MHQAGLQSCQRAGKAGHRIGPHRHTEGCIGICILIALIKRLCTWGFSRASTCCTMASPLKGARPLSMLPIREPRPPASISPVMSMSDSGAVWPVLVNDYSLARQNTIKTIAKEVYCTGARGQFIENMCAASLRHGELPPILFHSVAAEKFSFAQGPQRC